MSSAYNKSNKMLPPLPSGSSRTGGRSDSSLPTSPSKDGNITPNTPSFTSYSTSKKSKRPPPLNISSPANLDISTPLGSSSSEENFRLGMSNLSLKETPSTSQYNSNIVITQRSTPMLSTKPPTPFLESRSLQRKNRKQLSLDPVDTSSNTKPSLTINSSNNNNNSSDIVLNSSNPDSPSIPYKDPDRKTSTDQFIANVKNLELGLEYQVPIRGEELVLLKKLGSGNSGTVSKVLHLPTQKSMARKTIHIETKEVIQAQIIRELRIMHECDSPFIIGFYGAFISEGDVVICMEYSDCGSLDTIFKLTGPFPEFMLKHTAYSVLSGLNYLYDNHRIIHRDVKPSNVLLDSKGNMKLSDFGVSRELINSLADTFVGTSTYMSPERIQGGVYSVKGDVWSLGIMLYELASGKYAYSTENSHIAPDSILDLLQRIVNEKPPTLLTSDGFSKELCDFVSLSLRKEKDRAGPLDLMRHPFLADFLGDDGFKVSSKYKSDIKKWAKNVRRAQKGRAMKD